MTDVIEDASKWTNKVPWIWISKTLRELGKLLYIKNNELWGVESPLKWVTLVQTYWENWGEVIDNVWDIPFKKVLEKFKEIESNFESTLLTLKEYSLENDSIEVNNLFDEISLSDETFVGEIRDFFRKNNNPSIQKVSQFFSDWYRNLKPENKTAKGRYSYEYAMPNELLWKLKEIPGSECLNLDSLSLWESCVYDYWWPLTSKDLFSTSTWIDLTEAIKKKENFLLVWAWSWKTIEFLINQWIPKGMITCVDISDESISYITKKYWCTWYVWRLEDCNLDDSYDNLICEYFVDRDSNQRSTFDKAAKLANKRVVIEWLFPVASFDSWWTSYVEDEKTLITNGESAAGDMIRVRKYLEQHMWDTETRFSLWMRLVWTLCDQIEILPSWVISISFV